MRRLATLLLFGLLASSARGQLITYADMARIEGLPEVLAFENQLSAATAANDAATLVALAQSIDALPLSPLAQERLRVTTANHLALSLTTPKLLRWLERTSQRPVTWQVSHTDAGHSTPIPAYDAPAAARYALARLSRRRAAHDIAAAVASGRGWDQTVQRTTGSAKAARALDAATYTLAVRQLERDALARHVSALTTQFERRPELGGAVIEAARRLGQPDLLRSVVTGGTADDARAALAAARQIDAGFDHLPLVRSAIARPLIAADGLRALARASVGDPGLISELLDFLQHPTLSSAAAAALAAHASADLVPFLRRELTATTNSDYAQALILTLSLMPSPEARAALLAWSQQSGAFGELRGKLRRAYLRADP